MFHRVMDCGIVLSAFGAMMFYDNIGVAASFILCAILYALAALVVRP